MVDTDKHMVYAEDILWAIMQYPSRHITKSIVKRIIEQVVKEKEITVGMCMPQG